MEAPSFKENQMVSKYVVKRFEGDDLYSWAVFYRSDVQGKGNIIFWNQARPIISGLSRREAGYYKEKLEKENQNEKAST